MAVCGECRFWTDRGKDCYGSREGRCTANRERLFVLEAAINDIMPFEAGACPAFEPKDADQYAFFRKRFGGEKVDTGFPIEEVIKAVEEEGGR